MRASAPRLTTKTYGARGGGRLSHRRTNDHHIQPAARGPLQALDRISFCISEDKERPHICGALLEAVDGKIRFVATDGTGSAMHESMNRDADEQTAAEIAFALPNGRSVFAPSTPGDRRTMRNMKAKVHRAMKKGEQS